MDLSRSLGVGQKALSELLGRLVFVLLGIAIFRLGAHIPVPGVDTTQLAHLFNRHHNGVLGFFNMFSGGALARLTVFALGVMPYISASIIIQMMTMAVPQFEQLKKEGERGRRQLNQYTRYFTIAIASIQGLGVTKWLVSSDLVLLDLHVFYPVAVMTLVTGTLFLMWLGEQMTERGIGNGISLIILSGIISRMPEAFGQLMLQVKQGQMQSISLVLLIGLIVAVTAMVVFMERGVRQLPVTYAKRSQGQAVVSHLPLKINMSGVIPPIFASSIILLPATLSSWLSHFQHMGWLSDIAYWLSPGRPAYLIAYVAAIIFFCFFYTALVFNSSEIADQLKKSGGLIAGIRPGEKTAQHIDAVVTRLTAIGAIYLCVVALLPQFLIVTWHVPFYFGGTSLLIVVVVVMDIVSQIQTLMMSHRYESLFKKRQKSSGAMGLLR